MNDEQYWILLIEILKKYDDMLSIHEDLIEELRSLLARTGQEKRFIRRLTEYLLQLKENGNDAIRGRGAPMEHLSGSQQLCSMRFKFPELNLRILFSFQNNCAYLLCAFYERKGHQNTEYSAHIPIAQQRLNELMEEL